MSANITATADGKQVAHETEAVVRIRPTLSFRDARLEGFDKLMKGVKGGDKRTAEVTLTQGRAERRLRGKKVDLEFEVLDVKKLKLPELTEDFLQEIGSFDDRRELRDAIRKNLQRQLEYEQQQNRPQPDFGAAHQEGRLGTAAGPAQAAERSRTGTGRDGTAAQRLQRSRDSRPRERAAAEQRRRARPRRSRSTSSWSGSPRKRRSTTKKAITRRKSSSSRRKAANRRGACGPSWKSAGLMDVLRNQIIERKVLELVQSEAKFKDEPYEPRKERHGGDFDGGGRRQRGRNPGHHREAGRSREGVGRNCLVPRSMWEHNIGPLRSGPGRRRFACANVTGMCPLVRADA